jgi:hypothetical protein
MTAKQKQTRLGKGFAIPSSVCREDLESMGFDTTNVDDDTMKILASEISHTLDDTGDLLRHLEVNAERVNIPMRETKEPSTSPPTRN